MPPDQPVAADLTLDLVSDDLHSEVCLCQSPSQTCGTRPDQLMFVGNYIPLILLRGNPCDALMKTLYKCLYLLFSRSKGELSLQQQEMKQKRRLREVLICSMLKMFAADWRKIPSRLNRSLIMKGRNVWLDLNKMRRLITKAPSSFPFLDQI